MYQLNTFTFDTLFTGWEQSLLSSHTIDLGLVQFATVGGLLLLLIGLKQVISVVGEARIYLPIGKLRTYMVRMGYFNLIPPETEISPALTPQELEAPIVYCGRNNALLEFTLIDSKQAVDILADAMMDIALYKIGCKDEQAADLAVVTSELARNTVDHGGQGIAVMQTYSCGPQPRVEIAIADAGYGIRQSLSSAGRYGILESDADAIALALQSQVSRFDKPHRGNGLSRVVNSTNEHNGTLDIRSGAAKQRIRGEDDARWSIKVPMLVGTQITNSIPIAA